MKDFNDYRTKVPYPNRNTFKTVYVYHKGVVLFKGSYDDWTARVDRDDTVSEIDFDEEAYKAAVNAYRLDEDRLRTRFKYDMFNEFGVTAANPKSNKAFALAWQRGHSGGFSEVYNEFIELVEFIN